MKVGSTIQDVRNIAKPVGRLHFAGEATFESVGYVHGAFLSGKREAERIISNETTAAEPVNPTVTLPAAAPPSCVPAQLNSGTPAIVPISIPLQSAALSVQLTAKY